ncbi:MAG: hypothetical protein AAGF01_30435 [Cyanobacteria bacterium P01_G01_bin.38]
MTEDYDSSQHDKGLVAGDGCLLRKFEFTAARFAADRAIAAEVAAQALQQANAATYTNPVRRAQRLESIAIGYYAV